MYANPGEYDLLSEIKEVPIEGDDNSDEESEEQQISKLII